MGFFAAFFFLGGPKLLSFQTLQAEAGALRALAEARPLLFAGGYFAVYLLVTGLSLPGAAVLTLAGGALFGFAEGPVVVSFASALGAVLACALARSLFRPLVSQRFQSQLAVINEGLARTVCLSSFPAPCARGPVLCCESRVWAYPLAPAPVLLGESARHVAGHGGLRVGGYGIGRADRSSGHSVSPLLLALAAWAFSPGSPGGSWRCWPGVGPFAALPGPAASTTT